MTTIALPDTDNSERHARTEVLPVVRIIIYARLSQNRKGLSTNTHIQVEECETESAWYGRDHGCRIVIVQRFEEDDVSASKFSKKPRPLYEQMLSLIRQNKVDQIWCTEPERLVRRPREMDQLIDLAETTALKFLTFTSDESYDLSTPNGIFRARQAVNSAERESRKMSERIKRKVAVKAQEGLPNGGRRAYAFKPGNMELELTEVVVLRDMATKVVGGWSMVELAWWLNEQGHKTAEGHEWHPATVRATLINKRYVGIRVHKDLEYPAKWEPVFTPDEFDELQVVIQERKEKYANRPKPRRYLLTGLLICGKCGKSLVGQMKYDKAGSTPRRTYMCHKPQTTSKHEGGCHGVTVNATPLEEYIRQQIIEHLDDDNLAQLLSDAGDDSERLKELLAERRQKLTHQKRLEDEYADELLAKDEYYRLRNRVLSAIEVLDEQIVAARQRHVQLPIGAGQSIAEAWDSQVDGWRRMLVERVTKCIEVKPSVRKFRFELRDGNSVIFDTGRVVIDWRELSVADLYSLAALINAASAAEVPRVTRNRSRPSGVERSLSNRVRRPAQVSPALSVA